MIELTDEMRRELNGPGHAHVRDPKTDETYVLIRADLFERMRMIVDGHARRSGWDDRALDAYEQYRKSK